MRSLSLAVLLALGAAAAVTEEALELKEGRFRCAVPPWARGRDEGVDRREGVYGVVLTGPAAAEGPRPSLSIEFYAPGNALFKGAEDYAARRRPPGRPRRLKVAGRPARRWTRAASVPARPGGLVVEPVELRTDTVLIEAAGGFYLLAYEAPAKGFSSAILERALQTFELLPAKPAPPSQREGN